MMERGVLAPNKRRVAHRRVEGVDLAPLSNKVVNRPFESDVVVAPDRVHEAPLPRGPLREDVDAADELGPVAEGLVPLIGLGAEALLREARRLRLVQVEVRLAASVFVGGRRLLVKDHKVTRVGRTASYVGNREGFRDTS